MVRRVSGSSNGSARPGGLQRRDSGGSMTDRTFRDPSPNRNGQPVFYDRDAPPVPAVPPRYMSPPPVPAKSIRRPASVEPPERVFSPPPRRNGRGVSLDRGPRMNAGKPKGGASKPPGQLRSVGEVDHGQFSDTVNFSRPMSPTISASSSPLVERRITSPPSQGANAQRPSNAANVGRLRDGEAENIQYALQETAKAPVKKKKKTVTNLNAAGSHLAAGTGSGRVTGTAVQSTPQREPPSADSTPSPAGQKTLQAPPDSNSNLTPKKKKKKAVSPSTTYAREPDARYASDSDSAVSERSNMSDRTRTYNARAAGLLPKQPSIVREDREGEAIAESSLGKSSNGQAIGNGKSSKGAFGSSPSTGVSNKLQSQKTSQQPATTLAPKGTSLDIPQAISRGDGSVPPSDARKGTNRQSLSPARAAHFSSQPTYETPDGIKHQPPARSVSPAKSALKHSPSRGASPIPSMLTDSTRLRGPASEASDTTSIVSEDGLKSLPKKKKSVRISFDNESTVVGRAATPPTDPDSPVVMSPQNQGSSNRRWLPFGKDRKQQTSSPRQDEDTIIQPTPSLPSFGSVRGRSDGQNKRADFNGNPAHPQPQHEAPGVGTSADERVGNILSRVFAADDATSQTHPEEKQFSTDPLPPEVTSVEGSGYHSDTDDSVYSEQGVKQNEGNASASNTSANVGVWEQKDDAFVETVSMHSTEPPQTPEHVISVPSIAVQPATPRTDQAPAFEHQPEERQSEDAPIVAIQPATPASGVNQTSEDDYWVYLPGEFPVSSEPSDSDQPPKRPVVEHRPTEPTPAAVGIAEPEPLNTPSNHDHASQVAGGVAEALRSQIQPDAGEESEDTNNSIYSDAAEDMSNLEGDGFGSINAIVESPSASPQVTLRKHDTPESPIDREETDASARPTTLARNESELSEPGPDAGWDRAQEYWSGLSQQRKQQMERAAAREIANVQVPEETRPKPKKKTASRKSAQPETQAAETGNPPLPPWPDQQYRDEIARSSSPKASAMKKSLRGTQAEVSQEPSTVMKKSMRGSRNVKPQEPAMRSSMRDTAPSKPSNRLSSPPGTLSEPQAALQKKQRPMSVINTLDYNKPQAKSAINHDRAVSLGGPSKATTAVPARAARTKAPAAKPLQRNDSDSSSSFKKARPKTSDQGRYTMRRSMRGSSVDERPQSMHDRSTSLINHTTSPTGSSSRPFSTTGSVGPTMRTSMRGSMNSEKRAKSPPRSFGFGKSKAKAAPSGPKNRFSSRFGDSSDEDEGAVHRRSRFADSSDEDEPVDFTPVRGIPRRIDEGDSTDLEDSSDEKIAAKPTAPQPQPSKTEGRALGAGSLRPVPENGAPGPARPSQPVKEKEKKKRSFFGGLGSKKAPKSDPISLSSTNGRPKQDVLSTSTPKTDNLLHSPAPTSPTQPTSPNSLTASTQAKKSPKLQRRISAQQAEKIQMKRGLSDSWPLPQNPGGTSTPTIRPSTSDGTGPKKKSGPGTSGLGREVIAEEGRPGLVARNDTADTAYQQGAAAVEAVAEEKKKKGWFRKAFGR